jgi:transposase
VVAAAAAAVLPDEAETAPVSLESFVSQIEERLIDAVRQIVEEKLPEIVRSLLEEQIEKLKRELH